MAFCRVQHNKNYTQVNNTICRDKRISFKAIGIWLYAFSRPDDWTFNISDLKNQGPDGEDSVNSGLKELQSAGYLRRTQQRNGCGEFQHYDWVFYETPVDVEEIQIILPQPDLRGPVKRGPVKRGPENPVLLITDLLPMTEDTPKNEGKKRKRKPAKPASSSSSKSSKEIPTEKGILLSQKLYEIIKSDTDTFQIPSISSLEALCCDKLIEAGHSFDSIIKTLQWALKQEFWKDHTVRDDIAEFMLEKNRLNRWKKEMEPSPKKRKFAECSNDETALMRAAEMRANAI